MMICRNNAYQRRRIIIICVLICLGVILLDNTYWNYIVIFDIYVPINHIMHISIIHIATIENRACNMDNIAILEAYNEDDVFILTDRKYNNTYERFGFGYPAFYADTGLFSGSAYGVEGGPRSEIFKEQVETIDITEANKIYSKLIEVFINEFILIDQRDSLKLNLFCDIVDYLNDEELRLLRNTLYAINHYEFKSIDLREIFESCSWYTKSNVTDYFNELENVFLKIIQLAEQKNKSNTVK